jgi:Uma2 family endonuclease
MMVWGVNPKRRAVTVYRSTSDVKLLTEKDELSGEEVVAGFRCAVREIFATA